MIDKLKEILEYCSENTYKIGGETGGQGCEAEVKRMCREQYEKVQEALKIIQEGKLYEINIFNSEKSFDKDVDSLKKLFENYEYTIDLKDEMESSLSSLVQRFEYHLWEVMKDFEHDDIPKEVSANDFRNFLNSSNAYSSGLRTRLILDSGDIRKRYPNYICISDTELYFPYDGDGECSDAESYYKFEMLNEDTYKQAAQDYFMEIVKQYKIKYKPKRKIDKEAVEYKKYLKLKEKYGE